MENSHSWIYCLLFHLHSFINSHFLITTALYFSSKSIPIKHLESPALMLSLWCSENVNSCHTYRLNSNSNPSAEDFQDLAKTTLPIWAPVSHRIRSLATQIPKGTCTASLKQFAWLILFYFCTNYESTYCYLRTVLLIQIHTFFFS